MRLALGLGIATFCGGILWLLAGAGIYGSPVAHAFQVDRLTGFPNYSQTGLLLVTIVGPVGMLAYALLEWWRPRLGAVAMMAAGILVAEFGIRSGRMYWGYSDADALIVIGCISTPMLVLGGCLLTLYEQSRRVPAFHVVVVVIALLLGGTTLRLHSVSTDWSARCPSALERAKDESRMDVRPRQDHAPGPDRQKEIPRKRKGVKQDGEERQATIRPEKSTARTGFKVKVHEKTLSGKCLKAVANVKIILMSEDGSIRVETTSGNGGMCNVDVPKGRYKVTATHDEYEPYLPGKGFSVYDGKGFHTINIFLTRMRGSR